MVNRSSSGDAAAGVRGERVDLEAAADACNSLCAARGLLATRSESCLRPPSSNEVPACMPAPTERISKGLVQLSTVSLYLEEGMSGWLLAPLETGLRPQFPPRTAQFVL
jgi:hypothetical protein